MPATASPLLTAADFTATIALLQEAAQHSTLNAIYAVQEVLTADNAGAVVAELLSCGYGQTCLARMPLREAIVSMLDIRVVQEAVWR